MQKMFINYISKKNKLNHNRQEQGYKEGTYDKYRDGVEDNRTAVLDETH